MITAEAERVVSAFLAPLPLDDFFNAVGAHRSLDQIGGSKLRESLLGENPAVTLLADFARLARIMDCHSPAPRGHRPAPAMAGSPSAFAELIGLYHNLNYTVRLPEVSALAPQLAEVTRAIEILTHAPVEVSAFWSRAGTAAKIHYDNQDNVAVQLAGRKRWFISTDPPGLQNMWQSHEGTHLQLLNYRIVDVVQGDLVYIPRGLPHRVESSTDSIHLSIVFTPLTLRAATAAVVDHLADLVRPMRETVAGRIVDTETLGGELVPNIVETLRQLLVQVERPGFVEAAIARRASRTVSDLPRRVPPQPAPPIGPSTRLRHAPLGVMHWLHTGTQLDLAVPGGHILLHEAAGPAMAFIEAMPAFKIEQIPGLPLLHRIALGERLIAAGLLIVDG